ncbi:MAG: FdtA/QdtA family cupin domain-containing protein [Candidatus Eremiobacteraeota bacterium]|nr:FdtA/QdtA family cupin domain-containing protein [Candidatus Eremiobacteraeota bacterium]
MAQTLLKPYEVFDFTEIADASGSLFVSELATRGVVIERFYFITGVPAGARRGGHAHRTQAKFLVCVQGSVELHVEAHGHVDVIPLERAGRALYLPAGYWLDMVKFAPGTVLAVLAEQAYDEADYIRDHAEFERWELSA